MEACRLSATARAAKFSEADLKVLADIVHTALQAADPLVVLGQAVVLAALENGACKTVVVSQTAASAAGLGKSDIEARMHGGTELVWIIGAAAGTEVAAQFENLGGFAARLLWPFEMESFGCDDFMGDGAAGEGAEAGAGRGDGEKGDGALDSGDIDDKLGDGLSNLNTIPTDATASSFSLNTSAAPWSPL
jgi:hypothetical protein